METCWEHIGKQILFYGISDAAVLVYYAVTRHWVFRELYLIIYIITGTFVSIDFGKSFE